MENIVKSLINGNNKYRWEIIQESEKVEIDRKFPQFPLLILTCTDPRIDVHRIFQLNPGDAFVLRNAGNQYTEDVLRSILIAIYEYDIKQIVVLGHLDCGMKKINLDKLRNKLSSQVLKQIGQYSTNFQFALQKFFKPFVDEITNINTQIDRLKMTKAITSDIEIIGMLYDPYTGWVFVEDEFKKYASYGNFMRNYQKLLQNKRMTHIDYLQSIESEIVGTKLTSSTEIIEKQEPIDISEEFSDLRLNKEVVHEIENKDLDQILQKNAEVIKKTMTIISKVQVPKIIVPKIRVYIPKINKYKKEP